MIFYPSCLPCGKLDLLGLSGVYSVIVTLLFSVGNLVWSTWDHTPRQTRPSTVRSRQVGHRPAFPTLHRLHSCHPPTHTHQPAAVPTLAPLACVVRRPPAGAVDRVTRPTVLCSPGMLAQPCTPTPADQSLLWRSCISSTVCACNTREATVWHAYSHFSLGKEASPPQVLFYHVFLLCPFVCLPLLGCQMCLHHQNSVGQCSLTHLSQFGPSWTHSWQQ